MSRSTHNQRIARGLKKATGLAYQTCLNKVIAAAEAGLLPTPLDDAGIEKAVTMLASGIAVTQPADVDQAALLDQAYNFDRGLVLFVGPVATGKTTLLYDLAVKRAEKGHLVHTVESPIESHLRGDYPGPGRTGRIKQIEYDGPDGPGFHEAQRRARINDPDVLLIGEIRGHETAHAALQAADVGHLAVATMHSSGGVDDAIQRILTVFPPEQQEMARTVLSTTLRAVVVLRREKNEFFQATTLIDAEMRESIRTGGKPQAHGSYVLGRDVSGRSVTWRPAPDSIPVLHLVGPTGTGKSVLASDLASQCAQRGGEVHVIDTLRAGGPYVEADVLATSTVEAVEALDALNADSDKDRLLIVEGPEALDADARTSLDGFLAHSRSRQIRVVLISQRHQYLGINGSTLAFKPTVFPGRGWGQFHRDGNAHWSPVQVWGPSLDDIAQQPTRVAVATPGMKASVLVDLRRATTMLRVGMWPREAFAAAAKDSGSPFSRDAFIRISAMLSEGESLASSFRAHPHLFDDWVATAVENAEVGGFIADALMKICETLAAEAA